MQNVLEKADFILGEDVELFEKEFAAFCETEFAVGVDSGTSAIELALRTLGIGEGDEVITTANTYIATALSISITGATPILVDIHPDTYTIDVNRIEAVITERTKAIIPVHLYGHPADMDPIREIARTHKLAVVEDACQSHGAKYKGKMAGSMGHAAAFSFYPGKNLGAYGDAGMVVTNSDELDRSLRLMRNYGQEKKYHHRVQGYNRRLDTLQAAILRVKLDCLEGWNEARRQHAQMYRNQLQDTALILPDEAEYAESVYHLYVIRSSKRDDLGVFLKERGVATGIHYPVPIHLHQAYQDLGYAKGDFPITEQYADEILSLPMYPELTRGQIDHVCQTIKDFL
ncbi:MAG: DegT/DnrJ/EryC1/StrS family aminotransferase [bacterium]|nr:DegT/DnrJ/EryC1/StrS family aminotransferase [bacterium]